MKPGDDIFDHIEDYLNHKLSPEAQQAFEESIKERPDLSLKVKAHELANDMVLENRLLSVNKTLVDYHRSKGGWSTPSKIGLAVGLLAVGTGAFLYFSNTPASQAVVLKQDNQKTIEKSNDQPSNESTPAQTPQKQVQPQNNAATQKQVEENHIAQQEPEMVVVTPPVVTPPQEVIDHVEKKAEVTKPQVSPIVDEKPTNPCHNVNIMATLAPKAACNEEENGSISLSESKGGKAPYKMQVFDQNKQVVDARQLAAGSYEVAVKDAQGCVHVQKVNVAKKPCPIDYLFNAFAGEQLEMPAHSTAGMLKVFDKQGNIYANIAVEANTKAVWDGQSKNGELNEGFFNFVLEYTDRTTARGTITIVR